MADGRGTNTAAVALVLLGVSVVAVGIGAELVSAIQAELTQEAGQTSATAFPVGDEEAEALTRLMKRLPTDQERVQEDVQSGPPLGETAVPPPEEGRHGDVSR